MRSVRRLGADLATRETSRKLPVLASRPANIAAPHASKYGLSRQLHVESLQPLGGAQEQGRPVASDVGGERDLSAQQLGARPLEIVGHARLSDHQHPQRGVERAGIQIRSCGGERTLHPASGVASQRDGPLKKCRRGSQSTPRLRPSGQALEL